MMKISTCLLLMFCIAHPSKAAVPVGIIEEVPEAPQTTTTPTDNTQEASPLVRRDASQSPACLERTHHARNLLESVPSNYPHASNSSQADQPALKAPEMPYVNSLDSISSPADNVLNVPEILPVESSKSIEEPK